MRKITILLIFILAVFVVGAVYILTPEQAPSGRADTSPVTPTPTATAPGPQTSYKMGFIFLAKAPSDITPEKLEALNKVKTASASSFKTATRNLADMDTLDEIFVYIDPEFDERNFAWSKYAKQFYETRTDEFDFISIYTAFPVDSSILPPQHLIVSNKIRGIGRGIFDDTAQYGSRGKLKGINFLSEIQTIPQRQLGGFLHETGHQWCCYVGDTREQGGELELIQQSIHYNMFLNIPEVNDGYSDPDGGSGKWVETSPNNWTLEPTPDELRYSPLTLYFMGLLAPDKVPPIPIIEPFDPAIKRSLIIPPPIAGTKKTIFIDDVIKKAGKWEVK